MAMLVYRSVIHGFPTKNSNHFKNFQEPLEPHLALGSAPQRFVFFGLQQSPPFLATLVFKCPSFDLEIKSTMGKC